MILKRAVLWMALCLGVVVSAYAQFVYIGTQKTKEEVQPVQLKWQGCGEDFQRPLRVTTFTTNPPFGWTEYSAEEDAYISNGFGIDLIRKIAEEQHISVVSVGFKTDEEAMDAFLSGAVDMLAGSYYDLRLRRFGHTFLTPSFFQNMIGAVFLKGKEKTITTLDNLVGLKGVVRSDEQFYPHIHRLLPAAADIEIVEDSQEAFTRLLTGQADYLLTSPYAAEAEARRFKMNQNIRFIPIPIVGQELFVVYSGQSECPQYQTQFMEGIEAQKQSTKEADKVLRTYIDTWGERFRSQPALADQLHFPLSSPVPQGSLSE